MSGAHVVPPLTNDSPGLRNQGPVLNGRTINLRLTHPNLYRIILLSGAMSVLLGLNFALLNPTLLIYDQSNYLWGGIFLALGASQIVFLTAFRHLRLIRASLAASFVYVMCLGYGTCQPFIEGEGSLQLPLLYGGWATLQLALLFEPFVNPWTARRDL